MRDEEMNQLVRERQALIDYIEVKLEACDWHAVADACCDIREIEAQIDVLSRYEPALVQVSSPDVC